MHCIQMLGTPLRGATSGVAPQAHLLMHPSRHMYFKPVDLIWIWGMQLTYNAYNLSVYGGKHGRLVCIAATPSLLATDIYMWWADVEMSQNQARSLGMQWWHWEQRRAWN